MIDVHCLIVGHVSGCRTEFSVSLNHFVDSFQKVFFSCHFPSCSDGKHSSFCAYTSNFRTCEEDIYFKIGIVSIIASVFWQQSAVLLMEFLYQQCINTVSVDTEINIQCIYDYRSIIIYVALKSWKLGLIFWRATFCTCKLKTFNL